MVRQRRQHVERARGIGLRVSVVYRMVKAERFPVAARDALEAGGIAGVLHYSRRTAETYLACADADGLRHAALAPVHYCLSEPIGACLRDAGAASVRIAAQPDEASLLRLVGPARYP